MKCKSTEWRGISSRTTANSTGFVLLEELKIIIEGGGDRVGNAQKWRELLEAELNETRKKLADETAALDKLEEEKHKQTLEIEDLKRHLQPSA